MLAFACASVKCSRSVCPPPFFMSVPRRVYARFLTVDITCRRIHLLSSILSGASSPARKRKQICVRPVEAVATLADDGRIIIQWGRLARMEHGVWNEDATKRNRGRWSQSMMARRELVAQWEGGVTLSRTHLSGVAPPSSVISAAGFFFVLLRTSYVSSPPFSVRSHCCFSPPRPRPCPRPPSSLCVCVRRGGGQYVMRTSPPNVFRSFSFSFPLVCVLSLLVCVSCLVVCKSWFWLMLCYHVSCHFLCPVSFFCFVS